MAALLTGSATAALATIAVVGPGAWEVIRTLVQPISPAGAELPDIAQPGRFRLMRMGEGPQAAAGDEVVVAVKRRTWIEIHCHGGREVIRWLMDALQHRGVEPCSARQLEGMTSSVAHVFASAALRDAPTVRTAAILLDQLGSSLERAITAALAAVQGADAARAAGILQGVMRHADVGQHLTSPWRVAIIGPPNVGKSSLVNAIAGFQRSVVSPMPGTTRDVVATQIAVDGWPVELLDTAGWRESLDSLETAGISRATTAAADADLALWVLDASAPPEWPASRLPHLRMVVNKIDLPAAWDVAQAADAIRVSARTGEGMAELVDAVARRLVPDPPKPGDAVPFTPALCSRLDSALQDVLSGRNERAARTLESIWDDDDSRVAADRDGLPLKPQNA
jgi:tRNA modification GTPase